MRSRPLSEAEKEAIEQRRAEQEDLAGAPKRFAIAVKDIQEHGATQGCAGCKSALMGGKFRLPHTLGCRTRFEEALKDDKKVKQSAKCANEFAAKVIGADVSRRESAKKVKSGEG